MKWNRRDLLKSAAVFSASPLLEGWPAHAQAPSVPSVPSAPSAPDTVFSQGALGGGGYACYIDISPDGLTRVMRGDTYGASMWDSASQMWKQIMRSPNMDSVGAKYGYGGSCYAIGSAPSNSARIYMCASTVNPGIGTGNSHFSWHTVFRSDDRGANWVATGITTFQGSNAVNRLSGPKMAVDPNNQDIVYIGNQTGVFFVTYNAGRNWQTVDPLFDALPMQKASVSAAVGQNNIPFASNAVTKLLGTVIPTIGSGAAIFAYNRDAPLSVGSNSIYHDNISSASETHIAVPVIEPRTINGGRTNGSPGVQAGDRIYFGPGACVAIDGNSGTVANPGIALGVPGATGVASKNIYFGWCHHQLVTAMWWTNDGGNSFNAMTGAHPFGIGHMRMSNDGTLAGGGGNILYVSDGSPNSTRTRNGWRYVATPPKGSGLAADTWTLLPPSANPSFFALCPDPTRQGYVAFVQGAGNIGLSNDYGNSVPAFSRGSVSATGSENGVTDPPWLSYTLDSWRAMGDAVFDTQVSGKLWLLGGIGVWYATPIHKSGAPLTWYSQTRGIESLIIQQIVKAPAPNGRILLACQDRPFFSLTSPSVYPAKDHPYTPPTYQNAGPINQTGDIVYSDSDPNVLFGSTGNSIFRSADKGDTWTLIATVGKNGYVANGAMGGACCKLASISPISVMAQGSGNEPAHIQYGAPVGDPNVGDNWYWKPSLNNGSPVIGYGYNPFYMNNMKYLTSDGFGTYYYYNESGQGGGPALYKSGDGGVTLIRVSTPNLGGYGVCAVMVCAGVKDHLFLATGLNFGYANTAGPLKRTINGGMTWNDVPNTYYVWQVACGKPKPGNTYPAVYITGILTPGGDAGVFRSDDLAPPGAKVNWTRLDNIKTVTFDAPRALAADKDTYGNVYVATGTSGYTFGKLVQ